MINELIKKIKDKLKELWGRALKNPLENNDVTG